MPNWSVILTEIQKLAENLKNKEPPSKKSPFDIIRRKYLKLLNKKTTRNTILYASNWTQPGEIPLNLLMVNDKDMQGFMTVIHGLKGENLDIILHTSGGSPTATEALVTYLRSKFKYIRVIIPHAAMSAGTMLACSADEIIMGKNSFIGPTDPQIIYQTLDRIGASPAHSILDQFEKAKEDCIENPRNIGVWMPIIRGYGPSLLVECENSIRLSKELVENWLKKYMFKDDNDGDEKAKQISQYLSDHKNFLSHDRHIGIEEAKGLGLKISNLEDDQILQDLVLSVYHATTHTFGGTGAVKIIENHEGVAFINQVKRLIIQEKPE
ncbi:MAG: serine protease [Candidatus Lokiarchaeota archaeon]|nr:serine protease [Candidatus Lokiarchaeota archaeon]